MGKYFRPMVLTIFYSFSVVLAGLVVTLFLFIFRSDELFFAESGKVNVDKVGDLVTPFVPIMSVATGLLTLGLARVMRMTDFKGAFDCKNINWRTAWIPITGTLLLILIIGYSFEHIFMIPDKTSFIVEQSEYGVIDIIFLILLCFISPVFEELLFREANLKFMLSNGCTKTQAIIASAIFFAFVRVKPASMLTEFFAGIVFAIIYIKTRSVVLTSIISIIINSYSVMSDVLEANYGLNLDLPRYFYVVLVLLLIYPAYLLLRYYWNESLPSEKKAELEKVRKQA